MKKEIITALAHMSTHRTPPPTTLQLQSTNNLMIFECRGAAIAFRFWQQAPFFDPFGPGTVEKSKLVFSLNSECHFWRKPCETNESTSIPFDRLCVWSQS